VEKLPTVADLRARRLELTRAAIEASIVGDDLDHVRVVVETLAGEFELMDIALAAVKLAHEASGGTDDDGEIPEVAPETARRESTSRPKAMGRGPAQGMARLWVGAGRRAGIRPQDLVGAIANETSLSGRDIGAIEISDTFSLVEVPDAKADEVIRAIKASSIKGKKQTIRRDRS
jgi:ATP-dependent RNA helicase DeaD